MATFEEKLYTKLSTIFGKTIGQNLDIRQIDQINHEVKQLATIIAEFVDARAQVKALEIVKMLQGVTVKGFETMDAQVADLAARIESLEDLLDDE
jgi:hypothetical protein